tara:strand:+ start:1253 stop:3064 length:1812 start_codon:yes stop_codon:yes gene_type:complete
MCGIAGVIGSFEDDTENILNSLKNRGPDYQNFYQNKNLVFFHSLLKIMDLSENSAQPMIDKKTGNVIIFNGEIYNYKEIRKKYLSESIFNSDTDTEVILKIYELFGNEVTQHLKGMFVFAIYDNHKKKVLIFRDNFGIKPLYYSSLESNFFFSSDIKTLLKFKNVKKEVELNEKIVVSFIGNRQLFKNNETLFKNIKILPKSSFVEIDINTKNFSISKYKSNFKQFDNKNYQNFENLFLKNLDEHILTKHDKIACFLSGGLDSSLLASSLSKIKTNKKIYTFTALQKNLFESDNAKKINEIQKFNPTYLNTENINFFDELEKVNKINFQPSVDLSVIVHKKLCEEVRKKNIKIIFSGNGADEMFYGYPSHFYSYFAYNFKKNYNIFKLINKILSFKKTNAKSFLDIFKGTFVQILPLKLINYIKKIQLKNKVSHLNISKINIQKLNFYDEHDLDKFKNIKKNYMDSWALQNYLDYEDKNSMYYGIEIRVPYLDIELEKIINNYSLESFFSEGSKSHLRRISFLPDIIAKEKRKSGFAGDLNLFYEKYYEQILYKIENDFNDIPLINNKKLRDMFKNLNLENSEIFFRTYSYGIWYLSCFKEDE